MEDCRTCHGLAGAIPDRYEGQREWMGRQETLGRRGVESGSNKRGRVICREAVKQFGGGWGKICGKEMDVGWNRRGRGRKDMGRGCHKS